jgi:hypothetical protein
MVGVGGGGIGFFLKRSNEKERAESASARGEPSRQTFCQDLSIVMAQTRKVPMTQPVANALIGWFLLVICPLFGPLNWRLNCGALQRKRRVNMIAGG